MWKWAASEELIPASAYHSLTVVAGLQKGRTVARETEPIGPVDDATVDATKAHLNRHVCGLIEFQRWTGCRPGEACNLKRCDIDMGGEVWLYRPTLHKTSYRGKPRTIAIGPHGQKMLAEFFTENPDDFLFSPARAIQELNAVRSANRKTPLYPSHRKHNKARRKVLPKRAPAAGYTHTSYSQAVARACEEVYPAPATIARLPGETAKAWKLRLTPFQKKELTKWRRAHRWAPNQLRHSYATKVRKAHGLEAVQVLLGHSRADVTQVYAERNESLAITVASKIG